jgi:hypothetical protein
MDEGPPLYPIPIKNLRFPFPIPGIGIQKSPVFLSRNILTLAKCISDIERTLSGVSVYSANTGCGICRLLKVQVRPWTWKAVEMEMGMGIMSWDLGGRGRLEELFWDGAEEVLRVLRALEATMAD